MNARKPVIPAHSMTMGWSLNIDRSITCRLFDAASGSSSSAKRSINCQLLELTNPCTAALADGSLTTSNGDMQD
jgi:hypothetical protein